MGGGPALSDIIASHIDVYCDPATGPTPCIQAGTIPGFVITSKKRVATLPNVPTSGEADVPKFDVTTWYGMYAPRDTPKPIVDALVDALQKALKDPPVVNRFAELSMAPVEQERAAPAALAALLKSEIDRWDRIINRQALSLNERGPTGKDSACEARQGSVIGIPLAFLNFSTAGVLAGPDSTTGTFGCQLSRLANRPLACPRSKAQPSEE